MDQNFHRVACRLPVDTVDAAADMIQELTSPLSVGTGEIAEAAKLPPGVGALEALYDRPPDLDIIRLALASAGLSPLPDLDVEELVPRDWVTASLRELTEIRAGRFHIYGSHHPAPPRDGRIPLKIDAGLAFGTGHHETTTGCLVSIDRLARSWAPRGILDVGTGTGVLAMAAVKTWHVPAIATDIDPLSVRVTRANLRTNGAHTLARTFTAAGLTHPAIAASAPFDLVLANILARPLIALGSDICGAVAPGGHVVLAGLLTRQWRRVAHAYTTRGMRLVRRIPLGDWSILTLRRPAR